MNKTIWKNPNFYLGVAIVMMVVLFISSSQTYQQQSQVATVDKLLKNRPFFDSLSQIRFDYGGSEVSIRHQGYGKFIEFFIRKGAHFVTYFILGGSFCLALFYKQKNFWWAAFFGILAATGYAAFDEFHQMLTGGRTPLFQDVMLDACGAATAVVLILLSLLLKKQTLVSRRG